MDFALTETQEITRKSVRDFGERDIIPQSHAFDESQEFPHGWAKKMGELGLFGVYVPEKYGGAGPGPGCFSVTIGGVSPPAAGGGGSSAGWHGPGRAPPPRCGAGGQEARDSQ